MPATKPPSPDQLAEAADARRVKLGARFPSLVVLDPDNVFWLTGRWELRERASLLFDGHDWRCLVSSDTPPARTDLPVFVVTRPEEWMEHLSPAMTGPVPVDQEPSPELRAVLFQRGWENAAREIEIHRQVKDIVEIARVKWNVSVLNEVLEVVARLVEPGLCELEMWAELDRKLHAAESVGVEVTGNLATGARTLEDDPHATDAKLELGDLVLLDAYPRLHGYYADLTRTWACGAATAELVRVHGAVCRALEAVASQMSAGALGGNLDRLARSTLEDAGYSGAYNHHTGHGFGVKQQESPWLRPGSVDSLQAGMIIAVEPGCYLPGVGGIRLEQDFLVTNDGAVPLGDTEFSLEAHRRDV